MPHANLEERREYFRKWKAKNKDKISGYAKKYHEKYRDKINQRHKDTYNPVQVKTRRMMKLYKLSYKEWEDLRVSQNGLCAICNEVPKDWLVVDHDHKTGVVRGLLCVTCNRWLGIAEKTEWISKANNYLKEKR